MRILVCIKQVPGTSNVEIDPVTGVLKRDGIESKMNPHDLFGIETALRLAAQYGGEVKAITMGPPSARSVVLEAVYMGCESGCVLSDRRFAGADVLATSYTLSQGLRKMGGFDLIICGKQTSDGDTAQVGAEIAEFLKIPHVSNIISVENISNNSITVKANFDSSIVTARLPMPCLLCTDGDINTPRLPSYKRKKELGDGMIGMMSMDDFEDKNAKNYGLNGSPTQVERVFSPESSNKRQMFDGDVKQLSLQLYDMLHKRKFI